MSELRQRTIGDTSGEARDVNEDQVRGTPKNSFCLYLFGVASIEDCRKEIKT